MAVPSPSQNMVGMTQGGMLASLPMMAPQNQAGPGSGGHPANLTAASSAFHQPSNQQFTGFNK